MQSFLFRALAVGAVLALAFFALDHFVERIYMPPVNYVFVVVFGVLTVRIHKWLLSANEKSPKLFVTYFMGSISVKLFLTLIALLIYIYINREERVEVALSFFVTYVAFTVLEVTALYNKMITK